MINDRFFADGGDGMEPSPWQIENDQQAEWAMSKIAEAESELDRWETFYLGMIEQIRKRTSHTVEILRGKLAEYFETVPHKVTATQEKYSLPSGDLVFKAPRKVWTHDNDQLIRWAKENGMTELIKTTEAIDWQRLKKRLVEAADGVICDQETGLVCEAVTVETSEPEFTVRINKPEKGES